jgi:hypothetical protein
MKNVAARTPEQSLSHLDASTHLRAIGTQESFEISENPGVCFAGAGANISKSPFINKI